MHNYNSSPRPVSSNSSTWGSIKHEVAFAGDIEPNPNFDTSSNTNLADQVHPETDNTHTNRDKHERLIVAAYLTGSLANARLTKIQPNSDGYDRFYHALNHGDYTTAKQSALLREVATPLTRKQADPHQLLQLLNSEPEQRILALASGHNSNDHQQVNIADLFTALKNYPTPIEFHDFKTDVLRRIAEHNPDKTTQLYQQKFDEFAHKFYGKRQQYYEALQHLIKQASNHSDYPDSNHHDQAPSNIYQTPDPFSPGSDITEDTSGAAYFPPELRAAYGYKDGQDTVDQLAATKAQPPQKPGLFRRFFKR